MTWSDELGKRIRRGDAAEQAVSTVTRIEQAIVGGQSEPAAQLVDYFMEEAKVVFVIYTSWSEGFEAFLRHKGVPSAEAEAESTRLRTSLALDPEAQWLALGAEAGAFANALRAFLLTTDEAGAKLESLRAGWARLHDAYADYQAGLLTFVAERFGEAALGECFRYVLEPYLRERYGPFDVRRRAYEDTVFRNAYLSFEAMRGHLCGPGRRGDLEVAEDDDKIVIAFDPCGSGGRQQRAGSFGVTQERHDWAWNETGVCYYCAHCCFALELWPAEQWGHPVRIVDSPLDDEAHAPEPKKCTWTVYKRLDAIPPEAYERIGRSKPS
ncbi:MAG TPA: hypothetical protein VFA88_03780 [Gaiellaceae bacterium]|nr:hypothetical protein [Gaiellaceae bacterium]